MREYAYYFLGVEVIWKELLSVHVFFFVRNHSNTQTVVENILYIDESVTYYWMEQRVRLV